MKIVMVFGTFDILHPGHLQYFRQSRGFGDKLICVVARDETIVRIKGKAALNDENKRLENIKKLGLIDEVVLGDKEDPFKVIEKYNPDVICLGYDQVSFTDKLQDKIVSRGINSTIVRLAPYKEDKYKSSKLT